MSYEPDMKPAEPSILSNWSPPLEAGKIVGCATNPHGMLIVACEHMIFRMDRETGRLVPMIFEEPQP